MEDGIRRIKERKALRRVTGNKTMRNEWNGLDSRNSD